MKITTATNPAYDLIKKYEGLVLYEYDAHDGERTIGYGNALKDNEHYPLGITPQVALMMLYEDVQEVEEALNKYVTADINQNQYNALTSLVYNIGKSAFKKSKALKYLNNNDYINAAYEFFSIEKGFVYIDHKVSKGLAKRRSEENALFNSVVLI